jgi:hypothetical protein
MSLLEREKKENRNQQIGQRSEPGMSEAKRRKEKKENERM